MKTLNKSSKMQESQKDFKIFYTIFYYTIIIILGPVIMFFGSKILLDGFLGISSTASNVWSALIAIIVLHVVVGMYIYRAYTEPGRTKPDKID